MSLTFAEQRSSNIIFNKDTLVAIIVAVVLTVASYVVALAAGWITEINWLEFAAVITSYACTYLCVVQRRFNYVIAVLTSIAYGILFYQWGLYASMATQIYLIPTVIIGWFWWGKDSNPRPVRHVTVKFGLIVLALTGVVYAAAVAISTAFGGTFAPLDAFILAGTILAQFLMDRKKLESWIVWAAVNVVAIYLYFTSGLYLAAFQYVFFLANAVYAFFVWKKTMR